MSQLQKLLADRQAHAARTVVLLPYAQLMPLARELWAQQVPTGFSPRFETTMNWTGAFTFLPAAEDLCFDMGRDVLTARAWLERAGLGARADLLAGRLVEAAWQLAGLACAVAPAQRAAWAARARTAVASGLDAPALQLEAAVSRIAVEWAAASAYAGDALLAQATRDSIDLLVVVAGFQVEPLAQALQGLLGDKAVSLPLVAKAAQGVLSFHCADDPSDEAERAAACVLAHLHAGRSPVALAATDRVLTRRIAAMLAARDVVIRDETGWKLSTTRSAAGLMAALRACNWNADSDAVIDWLKNSPALAPPLVLALERRVRRNGIREWSGLQASDLGTSTGLAELLEQVNTWRADLKSSRPLPQWLAALRNVLQASGQWTAMEQDAAGEKVLAALRLQEAGEAELRELPQAARRWSLADFTAWVNESLEAASFKPDHPRNEQVVILPFTQVLGRPFAALVLPGCDEARLPASPEPPGAWTPAQREGLGLPTRAGLEAHLRASWAYALQTPHCDVLWRRSDDSGEPLLPSALVQSLRLEGAMPLTPDPRELRELASQPVARPGPIGQALPLEQLSASTYEDLRRCPYRFFALRQLGLQEADEIDTEIDKRDFGNWLHAVLSAFHTSLHNSWEPPGEGRRKLLDIASDEVTRSMRLQDGEFLPFAAAWPAVREGYLAWLAGHEASGAQFSQAESEHTMALGPLKLLGRIDRIDRLPDGRVLVMDYKTEALGLSRERIKRPTEDTQLAFYAALLEHDSLRAAYVNVGERDGTRLVEQVDVVAARDALVEGMLDDMRRIAEGAVLPALGEGKVCEFCSARGLCRRDSWNE